MKVLRLLHFFIGYEANAVGDMSSLRNDMERSSNNKHM